VSVFGAFGDRFNLVVEFSEEFVVGEEEGEEEIVIGDGDYALGASVKMAPGCGSGAAVTPPQEVSCSLLCVIRLP